LELRSSAPLHASLPRTVGGTKGTVIRASTIFRGCRDTMDPNNFAGYLAFRFKVHHLQNFTECVIFSRGQPHFHLSFVSSYCKRADPSSAGNLIQIIFVTNY